MHDTLVGLFGWLVGWLHDSYLGIGIIFRNHRSCDLLTGSTGNFDMLGAKVIHSIFEPKA